MFRAVRKVRLLCKRCEAVSYITKEGRRYVLSEAYRCEDAWNNRFSSPVIQKIKLDEMYHELDIRLQQEGKAAAVDIDLFANAVKTEEHADELEDLVHKLRLSENTSSMLPSTPHAVIRILLELGRHEQLLNILNDRINYGIFPDYYCSCLLMDTFLKSGNYAAAAKVAAMEMLQEDWSNPLTTHLALYSCHMYLKDPGPEPWKEEVVEENDTEEEVKVRVKYIRNPYFDDHFDLRDPQLLLGKTFATIGIALSDSVGYTYQLVGWALYKKWNKVVKCLDEVSEKKQTVFNEGIKILERELQKMEKDPEKQDPGSSVRDTCIQKIENLRTLGLVSNECLHTAVVSKVKAVVAEHEQQMITAQCSVYKEWEKLREEVLQKELDKVKTQKRLQQIQEEKERLAKQEEELFFFDNLQKLNLIIKEAKSVPKEEVKRKGKKKEDDENYIPPEVTKRKK
ncbi:28S ribosomal protein S27, mitochondrial-like isoform X1 [Schistocerca cancellata]|uniref:28S ribosomal protein S27, mitochondrial-like isoform X1 n=2 Tax=Schistocerca cancellata TaxID=274614 RepID=UPI002118B509|nr:28S ribosomal protein S27, mitochondrial-like isoform X1 [Schistocerca cancellata]